MRIYIDSNTFPATPGLYADAAKTKPIPRMIPAVELQRGGFEVAFLGANQPQDIASVSLAASIEGAGVQVIAEQGENIADDSGDAWRFNFALGAESLIAEIAKRGSVRLRVGVIVEDDTERCEWQFSTVVYPSASSEETDTEAVESAKNFAELAEQAAKRAQEAQADVAGNAQLAQEAKQTAMQAANAAIEAADNAEVSERNAAESKGAAEKAKTDAEAAKAAARKAANDAQATLGNVYAKSQIDGVDTGAELTLKMNEIIAQLKDWESVTGVKLSFVFWEAVMEEFQRWQKNPQLVEGWSGTGNPYNAVPPTKPVVNFNETKVDSFNIDTNQDLYFSAATNIAYLIYNNSPVFDSYIIAPNGTVCDHLCGGNPAYTSKPIYLRKCDDFTRGMFNCYNYDSFAVLPNCRVADSAFSYTKMSAANIAKTLDFLKKWEDGKTHNIGFTSNFAGVRSIATTETITVEVDGQTYSYDNFPRFATDDANETLRYAVARATAKGWTVQFSAQ